MYTSKWHAFPFKIDEKKLYSYCRNTAIQNIFGTSLLKLRLANPFEYP